MCELIAVRIAKLAAVAFRFVNSPRAPLAANRSDTASVAEIDGIGPVATRFGLGRHIRNQAASCVGHRLDTRRAHDQARRIDLRGSFGIS